ncbi:MAG: hypothetical protein WAN75_24440 [Xanthobacteraceae bacterium]
MQFSHLKRREFITLLGSAAAWPRVAHGQFKPAIIGVLGSGSAQSSAFLIDALKKGMNENGLAEGRDYVLDVRWAEGDYTRFATLAFESQGSGRRTKPRRGALGGAGSGIRASRGRIEDPAQWLSTVLVC